MRGEVKRISKVKIDSTCGKQVLKQELDSMTKSLFFFTAERK